jgi:hypothetical protein
LSDEYVGFSLMIYVVMGQTVSYSKVAEREANTKAEEKKQNDAGNAGFVLSQCLVPGSNRFAGED